MVWLGDSERAVVLNSDGELLLVRLSPKGYQEISRTRVIGSTWAHPAYAWGCVYVRSDDTIACVEVVRARRCPPAGTGYAPPNSGRIRPETSVSR